MSNEPRDAKSTTKASRRLLGEFDAPTYEEWRAVAVKSLKGAPFDKKLRTKTYEGITLDPIYRSDDVQSLPHMDSLPGFAPFTRGTRAAINSDAPWSVSHNYRNPSPGPLAEAIREDVHSGLAEVGFSLDPPGLLGEDPDEADPNAVGAGGVSLLSLDELATIMDASCCPENPVQIDSGTSGLAIAAMLRAYCRRRGIALSDLSGGVLMDPIGCLARFGKSKRDLASLYGEMAVLTRWAAENTGDFASVGVTSHCYHQAGASAVEELGFTLATGVEYTRELLKRDLAHQDIAPRLIFSLSVGGDFFMEVAKFRAARLIWALAMDAFGGGSNCQKMRLHARTSEWNKTVYDPYVNMLRCTSETFSAAIAGADSIQTVPFDETIGEADGFSRRMARNVQIILQEESRLGTVIDPAGGSFYLEKLTDYLARGAWKLFQNVERLGGIARALETGFVRETIEKTARARQKDLETRKQVIVGTNIYANPDEKPIVKETLDPRDLASRRGQEATEKRSLLKDEIAKFAREEREESTLIEDLSLMAEKGATVSQLSRVLAGAPSQEMAAERLPGSRRSEMFEKMRRAVEQHRKNSGKSVKVFLANMGPVPKHKARADFSQGFFEVAGIEVLKNSGFDTPEKAALAALESGADAAVLCSTDDTYPVVVARFVTKVKEKNSKMYLILAGYPRDQIDAHRESGIDEFIHIKANNYQVLRTLLQKTGVIR